MEQSARFTKAKPIAGAALALTAIAFLVNPLEQNDISATSAAPERAVETATPQPSALLNNEENGGNQSISADCKAQHGLAGADVVLLIGQSNMSGYGQGYNASIDGVQNSRIKQWSRTSAIVPASEKLQHADWRGEKQRVGMGTAFARSYLDILPSNRNVLLVPAAYGGTALIDGPWSPGGTLLTDAISRLKAALASGDNNCVAGILWHQGEADAIHGESEEAYINTLQYMVETIRAEVPRSAQAPFLAGEFTPVWTSRNPAITAPILSALRDIPNHIHRSTFVSADGIDTTNPGDLIHFDGAALRTYGKRYFDHLAVANANDGDSLPSDYVLLSQGKSAKQSSTDYRGVAMRAVDGNTSGIWSHNSVTHSALENQPWWQIDLGELSTVAAVKIWNRTHVSERLSNFYVFASEFDMTGRSLDDIKADSSIKNTLLDSVFGVKTIALDNKEARYIRVQLNGENYLSLAEVQVFGQAITEPPINIAPTVNLSSPTNDSTYIIGEEVVLSANTADADGSVIRVEFYDESTLIGSDNTAPFSIVWDNAALGEHANITAKAYDDGDSATTSAAVKITVSIEEESGRYRDISNGVFESDEVGLKEWHVYRYVVEQPGGELTLELDNLSDDIDLYVNVGSAPSEDVAGLYACDSRLGGTNAERCVINSAVAGDVVYVGVFGYAASPYRLKLELGSAPEYLNILSGVAEESEVQESRWHIYKYLVTQEANAIEINLDGLSSDVDLYVNRGTPPSNPIEGASDCDSRRGGSSSEMCAIHSNNVGDEIYIGVHGYQASPYRLLVEPTTVEIQELVSGTSSSGHVEEGQWKYFKITVPAQHLRLSVELSGMSQDGDLYVQKDSVTQQDNSADCVSDLGGASDEHCELDNPSETDWHIGVYGYQATDFSLIANQHGNLETRLSPSDSKSDKPRDAKASANGSTATVVGGGGALGFPLLMLWTLMLTIRAKATTNHTRP